MSKFRVRLRKSKVEAKAKVEKKLNLSLNLNLHEVRKPQPQPLPLSKYVRIPPSSAGGMNGLPSPLGPACAKPLRRRQGRGLG